MKVSRRNFLKNASISTAAIAAIPAIISSCAEPGPKKKWNFNPGDLVLFQGDSITDAGREKTKELPNNAKSFGIGYANIAASALLRNFPEKNLSIYNRGISGNKVYQLADRWEKDCLELKPDVLSILIGVNDYWHLRQGKYEGTTEVYETDYRKLLERTRNEIPELKIVICQPFILSNTRAVDEEWMEPFRIYQDIAKKMADEFAAVWVPFQEVFKEACNHAPEKYWLPDGVHPSMAGAQLMGETWLHYAG